ncbi:hypothetical protein CTAYLR_005655 [Chrysophaeum taylorii]|uniref:Uncharacterized protein n=1 Tax=Chrysophaeum taylorii TaxID=2483200 RepID=A0AAD7ULD3_9STRA|nr:hypothetical protein CTAYLR_005655 [Chrysophaeum taylorii]
MKAQHQVEWLRRQLERERGAVEKEEKLLEEELTQVKDEYGAYKEVAAECGKHERNVEAQRQQMRRAECELTAVRSYLCRRLEAAYPIECLANGAYSINGVELPPNGSRYDDHASTALGYVSHVLILVSKYTHVSLRYPLCYHASRSLAREDILVEGAESTIPLYPKDSDRRHYDKAVRLLVANVDLVLRANDISYDYNRPLLYNLRKFFLRREDESAEVVEEGFDDAKDEEQRRPPSVVAGGLS